MRRTCARRKRGFSLVEVMVSIFLVAATGTIFYGLAPMAAKTGKMVGNYQQASSILQHKVDQLRGVGYGRLTYDEMKNAGIIDTSPSSSPYRFNTVDALSSLFPAATGTIAVTDFNAKVKQVVVTLTWTGSAAKQGNGTLTVTALVPRT
ncbi:MAG: prepilin-type N-terminal cleavage/methylation domain-containing protein [Fimbriimonadaceae bacterium]